MSFHHAVESEFAGPMAGLIITADMHGFVVGFVAPRRLRGVLRWWGGVLNAWSTVFKENLDPQPWAPWPYKYLESLIGRVVHRCRWALGLAPPPPPPPRIAAMAGAIGAPPIGAS